MDEIKITLGGSILKGIDEGLRSCNYAIVVLSKYFFAKKWTGLELDALFGLETTERKIIIPIWKGVSEDECAASLRSLQHVAQFPRIATWITLCMQLS